MHVSKHGAKLRLVGKKSSVFSAPHPAIRHERDFLNALDISQKLIGKGISMQLLGILPKIAEVNDRLVPADQERIFEVHPEVSFAALNGNKPVMSKKGEEVGYTERLVLLGKEAVFNNLPERKVASKVVPGMKVNADDTLDAIIAAWSAERFANRLAVQIPSEPEFGFRGLAAQIAF
jgi:predicted RNase H-like nuclease